jgi:hypothetical protein
MDIETVPGVKSFDQLPADMQQYYDDKTKYQRGDEKTAEDFYSERAGILAEFGKVICISCVFVHGSGQEREFRVKSFYGDDEKVLLQEFADMLNENFPSKFEVLCAHNGLEFDFPYLSRRMLINGVSLPDPLDNAGKKPWEIPHWDTMELWKFGDRKNFTSLKLLAALFGIPTPKDDIDGSRVAEVYYNEKDLERIVRYCEKDTKTIAQLVIAWRGETLL